MSESQVRLPNFNEGNQIESADQLRANSHLRAQDHTLSVLELTFLQYVDHKFTVMQQEFEEQAHRGRRHE